MPRRALGTILALAVLAAVAALLWRVFASDTVPIPPPTEESGAQIAADQGPTSQVHDAVSATTQQPTAAEASSDAAATVEREAAAATGAPLMRLRVVDADDQPIVATVQSIGEPAMNKISTAEDGWCTLPIAVDKKAKPVRLRVEADGRHRQTDWQRQKEVTVKLPWVGTLQGRIVDDESGAAIAGAELQRTHGACQGCEPDKATSAADGAFSLGDVPRGEDCYFLITANGYPVQDFRLRLPGKGEPVDNVFRMRRGVMVTGRCIDLHTKVPLPGAKLSSRNREVAQTGAGGRFEALVLPPEDPTALLSMELGLDDYCRSVFRIERQAITELELPLVRALSLSGTVCTPAGTPIEGVRISGDGGEVRDLEGMPAQTRVSSNRTERGSILTDAQGRFELTGLPPGGKGRVRAWHDDYQATGELRWGTPFEAKADAPPLRIVLEPKAPLGSVGTIVGTFTMGGKPSSGSVRWKGPSREGWVQADGEGQFRIEKAQVGEVALEVLPDSFRWVEQEHRERLTARQSVTVTADTEVEVVVQLAAELAPITGMVRFDDGSPATKRSVYVTKPQLQLNARTDDAGQYTLSVPTYLTTVTISAGGDPKERDVAPGATGIDFVVPRQGTMRYRARREDGRREGIQFAARRDGEKWFRQLEPWRAPDPEGYRGEQLPRGSYTVVVAAGDAAPVVQHVQLEDEVLVDVLLPTGTNVTVRLAEGMAALPKNCTVSLVDQNLEREDAVNAGYMFGSSALQRRVGDLTKEATVRGIGPGRHRLAASRKGVVLEPDHVDVGTEPVTVTLRWREEK